MSKTWQIVSAVSLTLGIACLVGVAFMPAQSVAFSIALALGIALFPAGLVSIITALSSSRLVEEGVSAALEHATEELQDSIDSLKVTSTYLSNSSGLGLEMVFPDRSQALGPFLNHLEEYVGRSVAKDRLRQIIFVGSSLKGVIEDDPYIGQQLENVLKEGIRNGCDFYFLLTHPRFSELREIQEDRPAGGIAKEILHAIAWLEDRGVKREEIRLYKGTPTNFMIASTERMLINPYPYEREAYKCYCVETVNVELKGAIFPTYWINHFHRPWHGETSKRDHYIRPNSLGYYHELFDGPFEQKPAGPFGKLASYTDFFIMNDTGSFYLAVNIRGLESDIRYNVQKDESFDVFHIGERLSIKLLDRSQKSGAAWQDLGSFELDPDRNGFWQQTISATDARSFEAYSMIGVFDENSHGENVDESRLMIAGAYPVLWKKLPTAVESHPVEIPLPFGDNLFRQIMKDGRDTY